MKLRSDRRSADVDFDPAVEAEAIAVSAEFRRVSLHMARVLAEVERRKMYLFRGHATVSEFAVERLRLSGSTAMDLLRVGRQLDQPAAPSAEPDDGSDGPGSGDASGGGGLFGDRDAGAGENDAETEAETGTDTGTDTGTKTGTGGAGDDTPPPPQSPTVEDRLLDGDWSMANTKELDRLSHAVGGLSDKARAHWTKLAATMSEHEFRQLVGKAIEEHKQGAPTVGLRLHVTASARDDFHRAKALARQRTGVLLSEGQVFAAVARHFVRSFDKCAVGEKKRRTPHTKLLPERRYTPVAVERGVLRRDDGCCSVGDCANDSFLDLMHIRTPHALGGSREIDDLAAGCDRHHLLLDSGWNRFVGFDARGKPVYRAHDGHLLRRSPGPENAAGAGGAGMAGARPTKTPKGSLPGAAEP